MFQQGFYLSEVLFEFIVQGRFVKVMAVDPKTGVEVSIVGDSRADKITLQNVATRKLMMVLKRKQYKDTYMDDDI